MFVDMNFGFLTTCAKLLVGAYGSYWFLDAVTSWVEKRRMERSNENSWKLLEKQLYADSRLITVSEGREICVLSLPHMNVEGKAKGTVFFIHGSMARLSQFRDQIYYFQKKGYNVIAYDYFGMGRSPKERRRTSRRARRCGVAPNPLLAGRGHCAGASQPPD